MDLTPWVIRIREDYPKRDHIMELCRPAHLFYAYALDAMPLALIDVRLDGDYREEPNAAGSDIRLNRDTKVEAQFMNLCLMWLEAELRYRRFLPKGGLIISGLSTMCQLYSFDSVGKSDWYFSRMAATLAKRQHASSKTESRDFRTLNWAFMGIALSKLSAHDVLLGLDFEPLETEASRMAREQSVSQLEALGRDALEFQRRLVTDYSERNWPPKGLGPTGLRRRPMIALSRFFRRHVFKGKYIDQATGEVTDWPGYPEGPR
jgi:hypothetical protein